MIKKIEADAGLAFTENSIQFKMNQMIEHINLCEEGLLILLKTPELVQVKEVYELIRKINDQSL